MAERLWTAIFTLSGPPGVANTWTQTDGSGAITLGFSPRLGISKPFCMANGLKYDNATSAEGGIMLRPVDKPQGRLVLLQGSRDERFSVSEAGNFASQVPGSRVAALDGAGKVLDDPR